MSDNWFKRFMRKHFPSDTDRYNDGVAWGRAHFKNAQTEDEANMLLEGLPLEAHDPFDNGVRRAYRAQLSLITTFNALGPRPGPPSDDIPAWAQGPLPISEEFLVLKEADKWPAPDGDPFSYKNYLQHLKLPSDAVPIENPQGYAEWVRSLRPPEPSVIPAYVERDRRGLPIIRVKAGRRVI